nr:MAG TPA: hypothetical protein [Caudoviricetes sp.]
MVHVNGDGAGTRYTVKNNFRLVSCENGRE